MNNNKSCTSSSFRDLFAGVVKQIDKELSMITSTKDSDFPAYGVCNVDYQLRYITPENISEFIDNICRCHKVGIMGLHVSDYEMFSVESVKKFLESNGSCPFDNTTGNMNVYINPKEMTLDDMIIMLRQRVPQNNVYSKADMISRVNSDTFKNDIKTITDMKFTATMRNIVNNIDNILKTAKVYNDTLVRFTVEGFIMFSCVLLLNTLDEIISYMNPRSEYNFKDIQEAYVDENGNPADEYIITECCLLKTNNMMIKSKIPFNCNMRDIVLQDTHPQFEDTARALKFITKSKRSPISILIGMHIDKDYVSNLDLHFDENTIRLIRNVTFPNHNNENKDYPNVNETLEKQGFETTLSWLDTITSGNNYLDGNYRRDAVGNNEVHPIGSTLDYIYKTYNICGSCDNKELAHNLVRINNVMCQIIESYSRNVIQNHEYVRDILATLGECFTRSMLKLYYNNTVVINASDDMDDTMIPGMMYQESVVMEAINIIGNNSPLAGGNNTQQPNTNAQTQTSTTTQNTNGNNAQQPNVTVTNNNGPSKVQAVKAKMSNVIQGFLNWITNNLGQFAINFNKNHKAEIAYITKNTALHDEIKKNIQQGMFTPQINNFPTYKVPYQKLSTNIKFDETLKKYQNDEKLNIVDAEFEMYPSEIIPNIKSAKTEEEKIGILSNYILYGKATPGALFNGKLTTNLWEDIIENLIGSNKIINDFCKAHSTELKKCTQVLQQQARSANVNSSSSNAEKQQEGQKQQSRVEQLFQIVQTVSRVYTITTLNCIQSKFYKTTYKTYSDIIRTYNQQKNQTNVNTQTANPATPNNQPTRTI